MHHSVGRRQNQGSIASQIGVKRRCAHCPQPGVRGGGTGEGEDLVTRARKFWDQAAAKQSGPAGDKNSHDDPPFYSGFKIDCMALSRICSRTAGVGGATLRSWAVT